MSKTVSVYIRNSEVPIDENQAFEFKGSFFEVLSFTLLLETLELV